MAEPATPLPFSGRPLRVDAWIAVTTAAILGAGCGDGAGRGGTDAGGDDDGGTTPSTLMCDDSLKAQFATDANTQVLLVKQFRKGDPIALSNTPATPPPPTSPADLCLVKLVHRPFWPFSW